MSATADEFVSITLSMVRFTTDKPELVGHRGAGFVIQPSNTLVAFKKAIELGLHSVEFDVHKTVDGYLVVYHGPTGAELVNGARPICEYTYAEVMEEEPAVPLLHDVLNLLKESTVDPQIELKGPNCEEDVIAELKAANMLERARFCTFYHDRLAKIRSLYPEAVVYCTFGSGGDETLALPDAKDPKEVVKAAKKIDANGVDIPGQLVTPDLVRICHANKIAVGVYPNGATDDRPYFDNLARIGVDRMMADSCEVLAAYA